MAALAADVAVVFDPRYEIGLTQFKVSAATDIYYRGGLAHTVGASGLATLTPAATADFYAGVVMEHGTKVTNDLVWLATTGTFYFVNALFTAANRGKIYAMGAGALFDNPADLALSATTGGPAACGQLKQIDTADGAGYLNTNVKIADENL